MMCERDVEYLELTPKTVYTFTKRRSGAWPIRAESRRLCCSQRPQW